MIDSIVTFISKGLSYRRDVHLKGRDNIIIYVSISLRLKEIVESPNLICVKCGAKINVQLRWGQKVNKVYIGVTQLINNK